MRLRCGCLQFFATPSACIKSSVTSASVSVESSGGCYLTSLPAGYVIVDSAASQSVTGISRLQELPAILTQCGLEEATWQDDETSFQFGADGAGQAFARVQVRVWLGSRRCKMTFAVTPSQTTPPLIEVEANQCTGGSEEGRGRVPARHKSAGGGKRFLEATT